MTKRSKKFLVLSIMMLLVILFALNIQSRMIERNGVFLLVQPASSLFTVQMQALATGVLTLENGCLGIGELAPAIIWPYGSRLHVKNDEVWVTRFGRRIGTVGQSISMGGGFVSTDILNSYLPDSSVNLVHKQCGERVWIGNNITEQ